MAARAIVRLSLAAVLVVGAVVGVVFLLVNKTPGKAHASNGEEEPSYRETSSIAVKITRPKLDRNFQLTAGGLPATVEAYYRTSLESRVAGPIKRIRVDEGIFVKAGQELIQIDVPDLEQAVLEKTAMVKQREGERKRAAADVTIAETAVKIAESNVHVKEISVKSAEKNRKFCQSKYSRIKQLSEAHSVAAQLVDEEEKEFDAAKIAKLAAELAVDQAQIEVASAKAKLDAARQQVILEEAKIEVAKADLARAEAMFDFAKIKAPFDGVVVERKVDPGSFVQNATGGQGKPLLTIERFDIVTISVRVPDQWAPFVTEGTETIFEVPSKSRKRLLIHGKVTRFSHSLVNEAKDLTMRVEVDLWNGTKQGYEEFLRREEAIKHADLKTGPLPLMPQFEWTCKNPRADAAAHLLPGTYGTMTLVFRKFDNAYLLPSQAIVSHGGRSYVWVVKDPVMRNGIVKEGKAHRVPVELEVTDGRLAMVQPLGEDDELLSLTGVEDIIVSNQGELSEDQLVTTTFTDDWKDIYPQK